MRVTALSAEVQLPVHTYYVPTRRSCRRAEEDPGMRFVQYMRATTGSFAESARATLLDRWSVDGDASDASDEDCEHRGAQYNRLPQRMRRLAVRVGVGAAVGMFVLGFENCTIQLQPQYRCEWSWGVQTYSPTLPLTSQDLKSPGIT